MNVEKKAERERARKRNNE